MAMAIKERLTNRDWRSPTLANLNTIPLIPCLLLSDEELYFMP